MAILYAQFTSADIIIYKPTYPTLSWWQEGIGTTFSKYITSMFIFLVSFHDLVYQLQRTALFPIIQQLLQLIMHITQVHGTFPNLHMFACYSHMKKEPRDSRIIKLQTEPKQKIS